MVNRNISATCATLILLIFAMASIASGTECNADLTQGGNQCTVSASLNMNGTYSVNMNGSTSGALRITASNLILDCNRTTIFANYTGGTIDSGNFGIYVNTGLRNITVQNCKINNFGRAFYLNNATGNIVYNTINYSYMGIHMSGLGFHSGSNISNNIFVNQSYASFYITSSSINSTCNFANNTLYSYYDGVREDNGVSSASAYIAVWKNTFYKFTVRPSISSSPNSTYWNIYNNTIIGSGIVYEEAITQRGSHHTISYNNVSNTQYNIMVKPCSDCTVNNNLIFGGDEGIVAMNSNWIYIYNNTISNMTSDVDGYNIGMNIYNSSNVFIQQNNMSEIATRGINMQGSINVSSSGNTYDFIPLSLRPNYKSNDGNDIRCAISVVKYYKGFIPTQMQIQGNDNISITGETFDSDTPCYLLTENVTNLQTDLTAYKSGVSFTAPTLFSGLREWYMPSGWKNLSRYSPIQGVRTDIRSNLGGATKYINYSMTPDYLYLGNENATTALSATFLLSNALIYNSSYYARICSGTCEENITSNDSRYVLNNLNLTEGEAARQFSLVSFPQGTDTHKTISNSFAVALSTIPTWMNVLNCQISSINKNSKTYLPPDWSCDSNTRKLYFILDTVEAGGTTLDITYDSDDSGGGAGQEIIIATKRNPKVIIIKYPVEVVKNSVATVRLEAYDFENKLFIPKNITFHSNESNSKITIQKMLNNQDNSVTILFKIPEDIDIGIYKMTAVVQDQRIMEKEFEFNVVEKDSKQNEGISSEEYLVWTIGALIFVAIFSLIIILIAADRSRAK
jgi:parallel beta-helix repeat protein